MISSRFAAPVALLLTLALFPTIIHSYRGAVQSDARAAAAVPGVLEGMSSTPTDRRPAWVKNNFDTEDWVERVYRVQKEDVTLFIGRSYDAKRLYHHPELALLRGLAPAPAGKFRAGRRPDVPLHVLTTSRGGRSGVAVYALLYDGRFVENPLLFQLRTATKLLFSGRKPMTLFIASDLAGSTSSLDEAPATQVVLAAVASFERQPSSTSRR